MNILKRIFGTGPQLDFKELQQKEAIIIDVRSPDEFSLGHIKGSLNIPLHQLTSQIVKIKKMNKPVITCCLSGGRSSVALKVLLQANVEAYNGGGWMGLQSRIS